MDSILTIGSITAHFQCKKGTVTYYNCPHTTAETHAEIAKWVCESVRLFSIVKDLGF